MSLEEKENGSKQENNTPEPAGHTGEAGSENSAPVKKTPSEPPAGSEKNGETEKYI